ncbi:MAG TPA: lysine--tRNA ligase [Tepidisphaeraceae bacterium]
MEANPYEQERRTKLQKLRELGVDPYGQATPGIAPLAQTKATYKPEMGHDGGPAVKVAGRIMLKRDMGKLSFLTLRDETGDLQVGIDKKRVDEKSWGVRDLLDLGDQIIVEGNLGVTNKGEVTVWATNVTMASKALLPPPAKWEGLSDVELRYRQRYVDLWANPQVMQLAKMRIAVIDEIRAYMKARGFAEVETPMMQIQHGGANAKPFETHHNALDIPLYMRIAPELFLKRLLVGGMGKIFEINRNFRNEGISPRHNPEFTMLEAYEAYGSWETMADLVEGMICHVAEKLFGGLKITHQRQNPIPSPGTPGEGEGGGTQKVINLQRPWRRVRIVDLVKERTGWGFSKESDVRRDSPATVAMLFRRELRRFVNTFPGRQFGPELDYNDEDGMKLRQICEAWASGNTLPVGLEEHYDISNLKAHWEYLGQISTAEQLIEVYEKVIEPTLIDPCFVTHVPSVIIPLAKKNKDDPFFADVYELAINGVEISPGYSELNDPDVQAANFTQQVGDEAEKQKTDEDFLNALRYGMPPAGGIGLGIDRLLMMLTGAESIRDVILFPLMRPHA